MYLTLKPPSEPDYLAAAKQKLRQLVSTHLLTLAKRRVAGITVDAYGVIDASKWQAEVQYFLDKVLLPTLSINETQAVLDAGLNHVGQEMLEARVREECARLHTSGECNMTIRTLHPPDLASKRNSGVKRKSPDPYQGLTFPVVRGLIVREEPLERILAGTKRWEMRSSHTKIRGTVALIRKGSKAIFGVADIVDSLGELSRSQMLESVLQHGMSPERIDSPEASKYRFAWVLDNVRRLPQSIGYQHTGGVIFVNLDGHACAELAKFVASAAE